MIAILDGGDWRALVSTAEASLARNRLRLLWVELTEEKLHEAKDSGAKQAILVHDYVNSQIRSTTALAVHYQALHSDRGWPSNYKDPLKSFLSTTKSIPIIIYTRDSYTAIRNHRSLYKENSTVSFVAGQTVECLINLLIAAHQKIPTKHALPELQVILDEHTGRSEDLRVPYLPMLLLRHYAKAESTETDQQVLSRLLKNMRPSDLYLAVEHHFLR